MKHTWKWTLNLNRKQVVFTWVFGLLCIYWKFCCQDVFRPRNKINVNNNVYKITCLINVCHTYWLTLCILSKPVHILYLNRCRYYKRNKSNALIFMFRMSSIEVSTFLSNLPSNLSRSTFVLLQNSP